jgi:hypothetical protein
MVTIELSIEAMSTPIVVLIRTAHLQASVLRDGPRPLGSSCLDASAIILSRRSGMAAHSGAAGRRLRLCAGRRAENARQVWALRCRTDAWRQVMRFSQSPKSGPQAPSAVPFGAPGTGTSADGV